jgi:hypothetical protein
MEVKRKKRKWLRAGIGLAILAMPFWFLWTRDGHLLARATRVASIGSHPASYWWMNEDEVLVLPSYAGDMELPSATEYVLPFEKPDSNRVATRINVKAGKRSLIPKLTEAINKSTRGKYDHVNMDDVSLSPDGKQLLWFKFNSHESGVYICCIDGSNVRYWGIPMAVGAMWEADSRHWVALEQTQNSDVVILTEYSLEKSVHSPKWPGTINIDSLGSFDANFRHASFSDKYFIIDTGTVHQAGPYTLGSQSKPMIWQIPIGTGNEAPVKNPIRIQKGEIIRNIVYSPRGERAALVTAGELRPPMPDFVYRVLPKLRPKPQQVISLWVADIDSSRMYRIGWEGIGTKVGDLPDNLDDLRWTPDGKRLSFIHDGGLYTVPAD